MNTLLQLTPHDPLISRDGRPFGAGQGSRMRGLPWPLPSVVAGSFRTAIVKNSAELDFSGNMPQRLMQVSVAGVFPVHASELYLPAPNDAVAEPHEKGRGIKRLHRVQPQSFLGGCDLPKEGLQPVLLSESQAGEDFKPAEIPAWWPVGKYIDWLRGGDVSFDSSFLRSPLQETRDHVCLDAARGAAAEGLVFASVNLHAAYLPRFATIDVGHGGRFADRYAEVVLSARIAGDESLLQKVHLDFWHPLGGERRLVHWKQADSGLWNCPLAIRDELERTTRVRMILAAPAIFKDGWKPGWLNEQLEGSPPGSSVKLKLVGVSNGRWRPVSGWSLAPPRGPKPIRRMTPAGSVYFFEVEQPGSAARLADLWLQPVSDEEQMQRDGFGLAVWGVW